MMAEAKGQQEKGLAEARVIEATADANEKQGLADAKVLEERLLAQARGEAQVGATKALVTRDVGTSEADVLRDKLFAEAKGLTESSPRWPRCPTRRARMRSSACSWRRTSSRRWPPSKPTRAWPGPVRGAVGRAQQGQHRHRGGEGAFFDNFAKALSVGKAVEGVAGKSPIVQDLIGKFLSGKGGASLLNALGDGRACRPRRGSTERSIQRPTERGGRPAAPPPAAQPPASAFVFACLPARLPAGGKGVNGP